MGKESKELNLKDGYTIVYRCENKATINSSHARPLWDTWYKLPAPIADKRIGINRDEVCGCYTLKQFSTWWPKDQCVIGKKNSKYRILVVPTKYVRRGKYQCVFRRDKAVIVGSLDKDHKESWNTKLQRFLKTSEVTS